MEVACLMIYTPEEPTLPIEATAVWPFPSTSWVPFLPSFLQGTSGTQGYRLSGILSSVLVPREVVCMFTPGPGSLRPGYLSLLFLAFVLSSDPGSAARTLNKGRSSPHPPLFRNMNREVGSRRLPWVVGQGVSGLVMTRWCVGWASVLSRRLREI